MSLIVHVQAGWATVPAKLIFSSRTPCWLKTQSVYGIGLDSTFLTNVAKQLRAGKNRCSQWTSFFFISAFAQSCLKEIPQMLGWHVQKQLINVDSDNQAEMLVLSTLRDEKPAWCHEGISTCALLFKASKLFWTTCYLSIHNSSKKWDVWIRLALVQAATLIQGKKSLFFSWHFWRISKSIWVMKQTSDKWHVTSVHLLFLRVQLFGLGYEIRHCSVTECVGLFQESCCYTWIIPTLASVVHAFFRRASLCACSSEMRCHKYVHLCVSISPLNACNPVD